MRLYDDPKSNNNRNLAFVIVFVINHCLVLLSTKIKLSKISFILKAILYPTIIDTHTQKNSIQPNLKSQISPLEPSQTKNRHQVGNRKPEFNR